MYNRLDHLSSMTDFEQFTTRVLRHVLATKSKGLMLAWDANYDHYSRGLPEARWRDVCDFIAWSPDGFFYDYEIDDGEYSSRFLIYNWAWALNFEWALSADFLNEFGSLHHFDVTKTWDVNSGTSIGKYVKKLHEEVGGVRSFAGFSLVPSISEQMPPQRLMFIKETDAVIAKIYDEQLVEEKRSD